MFLGDISTKVLILSIVVFVGAISTILTLNAQGTDFETQLRVFLNYGVPSVIGLATLSVASKTREESQRISAKVKTIETNTNGNMSRMIDRLGTPEEKEGNNEGR